MERLALLAVTAHPGDELALAGTLAHHARADVHVALACATDSLPRPDDSPPQRQHDLRCACARLGVAELHMLGYRPSVHNAGSGALLEATACAVVRQLVHLIRTIRPQVMVTFGPDGIDGQVDHVAIGGLATQAFGAAADLEQFPINGGPAPYAPTKLYYLGLPQGLLRLAGITGPGTPEAAIAARLDVTPLVDAKLAAARCYQAELEVELAQLYSLPPAERRHLLSVEFLSLAQPQPAVDDRSDPHLFAGIP
jgi:LmbE family N-acetylglucosaminyl deacetylase